MSSRPPLSGAAARLAERWLSSQRRQAGALFSLSVVMATLNAVMMIAQCWLLAWLIDSVVIGGKELSGLFPALWLLPLVMLLRAGLEMLRQGFAFESAARIRQTLRSTLLERISALGPSWSQQQRTGSIASTLGEGVDAIETYFSAFLPQKIIIGVVPLAILVALFPSDWVSGLIMLITAPLIPLFMIIVGKGAEKISLRQWRKLSLMSAHFFDVIAGLTTLRQTNAARRQAEIIAAISENYRQTTMKVLRVAFLSSLVLEFLATVSTAMVAVYVGFRLYYGELAFLPGLFALLLAPEFFRPLRDLGAHYHARMDAIGATEGLLDILNTELPEQTPTQVLPVAEPQEIRVENLGYQHPEGGGIEDISFSLRRGETLAIVGSSGAGKTTLARLLLRFISPTRGNILVNGQDLSQLDLPEWQKQIGWLPQRPTLFAGSIADNICLAHPQASESELKKAARLAQADGFINGFADGYATQLGDGGQGLSGGQVQRVAMARALLTAPPVMILDEPTSSLDSQTAHQMMSALVEAFPDSARLVITHDTSVAVMADRIVVLAQGRVIESGTPAELLQSGGVLAELERLQKGATE
ncbi:thiol reductant ABC exporter subunit CydD [Tatumella citrea]|uniref:ABC-type xenobiotic transporter n=1 Tax=Tatumella citrea TaxID=53336 RepID=A0A1Y0LAK5_TATCI|nr:thiol reductant ABC exporter subunit CydD [Tatumella citrea]ARU94795.1 thiol reductant ABC exporter subunit CydD [Tatumella citrea]ARU98833.1 thiol reductant ABC exporter subunit CydD [Tatumella citrea]